MSQNIFVHLFIEGNIFWNSWFGPNFNSLAGVIYSFWLLQLILTKVTLSSSIFQCLFSCHNLNSILDCCLSGANPGISWSKLFWQPHFSCSRLKILFSLTVLLLFGVLWQLTPHHLHNISAYIHLCKFSNHIHLWFGMSKHTNLACIIESKLDNTRNITLSVICPQWFWVLYQPYQFG